MNNDKPAMVTILESTDYSFDSDTVDEFFEQSTLIINVMPEGLRSMVKDMVLASYKAGLMEGKN